MEQLLNLHLHIQKIQLIQLFIQSDAQLPPEVYAVESRVKDDIYNNSRNSDYASRASGGARTATEASIISSQTQNRVQRELI